jgi:hypothetical protein
VSDEYERLVLKRVREYLAVEGLPSIKSVRLEGEAPDTEVVATIHHPSENGPRDYSYEIYHPAFNGSGEDDPDGVGTLIAVSIDEDAGADFEPVDPVVAKAILDKYSNRRA